MASKVNVNKATREELVDVAGLRPTVADAILKAREETGGKFADVDALKEAIKDVKGIGQATIDQLGDVLAFGAQAAKQAVDKGAEAAETAAHAGAETAKAGVEATRHAAERTAEVGAEATRRATERTAEVTSIAARGGAEAAQRGAEAVQRAVNAFANTEKQAAERSGQAATELSQLVVSLVNEQLQANVETLRALARARTWREALDVQNDFFRGNLERATSGTSRYIETVTKLVTGVAQVGRQEARKAA